MIKNKKILIIILLVIALMMLIPNKSKAGLQANKGGTSLTNVTADDFFIGARRMETQYGTLGKKAELNDKYLDTTKNGIDAHMALNTEWGTVALLTDSIFGVGTAMSGAGDSGTSTGNKSGVYNFANEKCEYVATIYGGKTNENNKIIGNSDSRYYNNYTSQTSKPGDALNCTNWLGADTQSWISLGNPVFARNGWGLFGYHPVDGRAVIDCSIRAVVVCGSEL